MPPTTRFVPWRAGMLAPFEVARDVGVFLQMAGPWALGLAMIVGGMAAAVQQRSGGARPDPVLAIGALVLVLALMALSAPVIAAAWLRWAASGQRPRWRVALPDRASLALLWRLWLVFVVTDRAIALSVGGFQRFAPEPVPMAAGLIAWAIVIYLAAYLALGLPAIAVGDREMRGRAALLAARRLGPGHGLGLLFSILPFVIAGKALELWAEGTGAIATAPAHLTAMICEFLAVYAAIASGAQYLAGAYRAAQRAV